ncbi:MAG TPA: PilZ domain-containing protein [Allosphingosinicella sp.]|nr:PilZ domain-containing protein [Allosphingosinicella sp.]
MGVENFVNSTVGVGNRSTKRARVLLTAKIVTPSEEIDARVRDLSRKGTLLECGEEFEVGTEVTFKRGSTVVPARVAWTGGGRVGLEFLSMIEEEALFVRLKPTADADSKSLPGNQIYEKLSQRDLKRAEAWGATVGLEISSRSF